MKIIQTCGSPSWGGLEMIALQTAEMLKERGHDITMFCRKKSKLFEESRNSKLDSLEIFDNDRNSISTIAKIKKILKSDKFDIIHSHLSHDLWTLVPSMTGYNAKLFLTKHMGSYIRKKDLFHKYLYNRVDSVFAISNYIKESLISTCPLEKEKIILLPDFIQTNKFNKEIYNKEKTRNEFNISGNILVIGMTGRLTPGKGHEDFIEAAKIVCEKVKINIKFIIIGGASTGEEDYERKIKFLISESGITDKIILTGHRTDIANLMNIMDIFVLPSHEESFGIVLLEAMAMMLPVIASNNAGAKDIVINNETGILIEPKNPEKLADKMIEMINNPEKINKYGGNGRHRVEENFSSDKIITKLIEYYNA